jgi:hypothetical protein
MRSFVEFVDAQIRKSDRLQDALVAEVTDGEIPMTDVDVYLSTAVLRDVRWDRMRKQLSVKITAYWDAYLAIDDEHEMTERGAVFGEATFRHAGRSLEYVTSDFRVRYETFD